MKSINIFSCLRRKRLEPELANERIIRKQERIKKVKALIENIKKHSKDFCTDTTIHGFSHLVDPTSHIFQKCIHI